MSLYFKFEEDTMKNEIPAVIFLIIFPDTPPPPPPRLMKITTKWIEEFHKLF